MINKEFSRYKIILASRSPRRQQLLRELGLDFDIVIKEFDESFPEGLTGEQIAASIASSKAKVFKKDIRKDEIVITADTIVWCNGLILGKPADEKDAIRMLTEISGNTHEVITGVSLLSAVKQVTFTDSTYVTFEKMNSDEIKFYVEHFAPYDKAGAYGIQEWIGLAACSHIEGSYFNVVGLPVQKLYNELKKFVLQ